MRKFEKQTPFEIPCQAQDYGHFQNLHRRIHQADPALTDRFVQDLMEDLFGGPCAKLQAFFDSN
jgi:hypothetical protein